MANRYFAALFLCACQHLSAAGGPCTHTTDCSGGYFCLSGKCEPQHCSSNADCGDGQSCNNAVCAAGNVPAVSAVSENGDGSFTVTGTHLDTVTGLTLQGTGIATAPLKLRTGGTGTQLVATASASLALAIGVAYDLIVATASADTTVTVTFTLPNNVVTTPSGCAAGQTLTYNGTTWACSTPAAPDFSTLSIQGKQGISVTGDGNAGFALTSLLFGVAGSVATVATTNQNVYSVAACGANGRLVSGFCITNPTTVPTGASGIWKNGAYDSSLDDVTSTALATDLNPPLGNLWVCNVQNQPTGTAVQSYAICISAPAIP